MPYKPISAFTDEEMAAIAAACPFHVLGVKFPQDMDCWPWMGKRNRKGYGVFSMLGYTWLVHRLSWIARNGAIPEGLQVNHVCNVPQCWRPSHLYLGTQQDNTNDSWRRS